MFIYAVNILKKSEICEDIVQDIFIDFWSKRNNVNIGNIKSYLFQSIKFQIFKHMRDQRISNEDLTRLNIIDVSMDSSQKLEFDELETLLKDRVNTLSPKCQIERASWRERVCQYV